MLRKAIFLLTILLFTTGCSLNTEIKSLLDNTPVPTLKLSSSVDDIDIWEGEVFAFAVVLSEPMDKDANFAWSIQGGQETDFESISGVEQIAEGQTSFIVRLRVINDGYYEPKKNLNFVVTGKDLAEDLFVPLALNDDDEKPSIYIDDLSVTEGDTGNLVVRLSAPAPQDLTFNIAQTGTSSAEVDDFVAISNEVRTIPKGQTVIEIPFVSNEDTEDEINYEYLYVALENFSNDGLVSSGDNQATVYIIDDDSTNVYVYWKTTYQEVTEGVGSVSAEMAITKALGVDLTVNMGLSGSATNPGEHDYVNADIVIPAGSTSHTFNINIVDDALPESDKDIRLQRSGTSCSCSISVLGNSTHRILIVDDEVEPELTLASTSTVLDEDAGLVNVVVNMDKIAAEDVTVPFSLSGVASRQHDYSVPATSVTIPAGSVTANIPVTISDDLNLEEVEDLVIELGVPDGASLVGNRLHTITINDNDVPPEITLKDVTQKEGCDAVFVAELSGTSYQPVTFSFTTLAGSASSGSDFVETTVTRTIPPGQLAIGVGVPLTADASVDADETFGGTISNPINATIATANATATVKDEDFVHAGKFKLYDAPNTLIGFSGSAKIDDKGCYAVFTGDLEYDGVFNTYHINLFGESLFRLHPEIPFTADMTSPFVLKDGSRVIINGELEEDTKNVLISMKPDGSDAKRLNPDDSNAYGAELILNESRVIFRANPAGGDTYGLYSAKTDGSADEVQLSDPFVNGGCVGANATMSDSDSVAYYRADTMYVNSDNLYKVNSDGSSSPFMVAPFVEEGKTIYNFQLSDDGSKILLQADYDVVGKQEIYTVNSDGTGFTKVNVAIPDDYDVAYYAISPDGNKVAYHTALNIDGDAKLRVVDSDGSNPLDLRTSINDYFYDITWTPDSARIIYCGEIVDWMRDDIYSIQPNGSGDVRLSPTGSNSGSLCGGYTFIDNSTVMFRSYKNDSHGGRIYKNSVAGGALVMLSRDETIAGHPNQHVSPDKTRMIYTQNRSSDYKTRVDYIKTDNTGLVSLNGFGTTSIHHANWDAGYLLLSTDEIDGIGTGNDLVIESIPAP